MTVADLVIVPGILFALFLAVLLGLSFYIASLKVRAARAALRQTAEWQRAFRALQDACDQVITELASHPATYQTFPEDVRSALYAAHDSARQLEGMK